jgi:hypothetical protein
VLKQSRPTGLPSWNVVDYDYDYDYDYDFESEYEYRFAKYEYDQRALNLVPFGPGPSVLFMRTRLSMDPSAQ